MPLYDPCACPNINRNPVNVAAFDIGTTAKGNKSAYNPINKCVYFISNLDRLIEFNTETHVSNIYMLSGGFTCYDIIYNPVNGLLYIGTNTTSVIRYDSNTHTQLSTISTNRGSSGLTYIASNNSIYIVNISSALSTNVDIDILNCATNVITTFNLFNNGGLNIIVLDIYSVNNKLYVTAYWTGGGSQSNLYYVDITNNTSVILISNAIADALLSKMAFSGTNNILYVITYDSNLNIGSLTKLNTLTNVNLGVIATNTASIFGINFNAFNDFLFMAIYSVNSVLIKFLKTATDSLGNLLSVGGNSNLPVTSFVTPPNSQYTYAMNSYSNFLMIFGSEG